MHTESEAREKWCPDARTVHTLTRLEGGTIASMEGHNLNRVGDNGAYPTACRCTASGCMSWRWATWEDDGTVFRPTGPNRGIETDEHMGYCGRAGKP